MAVRKVWTIKKHEKFLRAASQPVKKINREIKQLCEDIIDTIKDNEAIGLAAPQIGVHKRMFGVRLNYVEDQPEEEMSEPIIMINPEFVEQGTELERGYDGCLSIPGMMGYTDRKTKLKVRFQDQTGKRFEREFEGFDARAIQHEMDHLDGILYIDRLNSLDDLYVYVYDDEDNVATVPYLQVVKQAEDTEALNETAGAKSDG
jgi:peptide deformylase